MADYIVKDTELTSVANAIRTAGGTNSLLSFPNGFVSAVNNISGGGGSSDFSTAQVTIINNAQSDFVLYFPNIFDNRVHGYLDSSDIDGSPVEAVLYKGACHITYTSDDTLNISVTGNATISRREVIVTGDCTITIS